MIRLNSTVVRLQFDRVTTIRRPMLVLLVTTVWRYVAFLLIIMLRPYRVVGIKR